MLTDWQQVATIVGVLSGLAVGIKSLFSLCKFARRKLITMFGINALRVDIEALTEDTKFIVSELRENGGTSVKDSLNRIELRQLFQEQRQWAILSDMSTGVFETDEKGEFVRVNRKYLRMTGRAPDEVKGSGWINTIAQQDKARIQEEWDTAVHEEREFEAEFMIITPDEDRMQVSVRTYKMVSPEDDTLGYLGMMSPAIQ